MGRKSRSKGRRIELECVHAFRDAGIPARRRQAAGLADNPEDPDLLVAGILNVEVKARKEGFKLLRRWLKGHDLLLLRADRQPTLAVMEWEWLIAFMQSWHASGACTDFIPEGTEGGA